MLRQQVFTFAGTLLIGILLVHVFENRNHHDDDEEPLAFTRDGILRGAVWLDRRNRTFYAFQAVPYAKPPIGPLRFKPAEYPKKWSGIRDARQPIPMCPQLVNDSSKHDGSEDCLYMNVFTHHLDANARRPVMVYLHGGALSVNSATTLDLGPQHLMTADIVLVTINYRIGILGFISADSNDVFTANNGLRDQLAALKWIQINVHAFGGDPDSVTVFGNSAGALATHFHLFSPLADGLFHRAIMQSGTAFMSIGEANTVHAVAENLHLQSDDLGELLVELQRQPLDAIMRCQHQIKWMHLHIHRKARGGVVIDGDYLPDNVWRLQNAGSFKRIPIMIGNNDRDGIIMKFNDLIHPKHNYTTIDNNIPFYIRQGRAEFADKLNKFYFNDSSRSVDDVMIDLWSDVWFHFNALHVARHHSRYADVYMYRFALDAALNCYKRILKTVAHYKGACHGDELGYLFRNWITADIQPNSIEDITTERLVKLWTNFATYGQPTLHGSDEEIDWRPLHPDDVDNNAYIGLHINESLNVQNLYKEMYAMWSQVITKDVLETYDD